MRSASFVVLLLLAASLAGCSGNDDSIPNTDHKDEEIFNLNGRLNESAATIESLEEKLAELQNQAAQVPSLQATIDGLSEEMLLLNGNISNLEESLQELNNQYLEALGEIQVLNEELLLAEVNLEDLGVMLGTCWDPVWHLWASYGFSVRDV